MNTSERRRHPRVELVTKVTHVRHGVYQYYYSRDLSRGGIFIETKDPYDLGTKLELDFSLPEGETRIRIEGEVVRTVEPDRERKDLVPGMGFSFTNISDENKAILIAFLKEY